jgi:flavin reductase (DIM6/NTAB) family NADH-FMN oxidoreductase RutF
MKKVKIKLEPIPLLFPHPAVLIGANVNGKPDFATVAWINTASGTPPTVAIALNHVRHSLKGIRENMTFSVNIPGADLVKETDYCGLVSGAKRDKAKDCGFKVFYGELDTAPFIEQCPANISCVATHLISMGSHYLVTGVVKEVLVSDDCLTDGKPDVTKIKPLIYVNFPSMEYHAIGELVAPAFHIGKEIKGALSE